MLVRELTKDEITNADLIINIIIDDAARLLSVDSQMTSYLTLSKSIDDEDIRRYISHYVYKKERRIKLIWIEQDSTFFELRLEKIFDF